ncbi:unnamed protein product [Adineta ricciae]|uniref:Uncharacterized protein n=1 Tax=Adineta ricciae TaxID=249248 RepID=A0A815DYK1_ADIRI|nr:unnamed protein product [Adineta ricciae]
MAAFFITIIFAIVLGVCSSQSSSGRSSSFPTTLIVFIPVFSLFFIFMVALIIWKKKCGPQRRFINPAVIPLATQMAFVEQQNRYQPPIYNQAPMYNQIPMYNSAPPSNQPFSYGQPPPYSQTQFYNQPAPYPMYNTQSNPSKMAFT